MKFEIKVSRILPFFCWRLLNVKRGRKKWQNDWEKSSGEMGIRYLEI